MERGEWLEARRGGIGASDAPAVCGVSPWKTPLHVYLEKTGELEDSDSKAKEWGRKLEDIVAQAYSEETGRPVYKPARPIEYHPQLPWLRCSLDRLTEADGKGRVLECKTVRADSDEWGAPGTDEIPLYYLLQCQHQLCVTGMERCDLAALFGGQELRVYEVERDEEVLSSLRRICAEFWNRVEKRSPPPPQWKHPETPALIAKMQRLTPGSEVELDPCLEEVVRRYRWLGGEVRGLEAQREQLKARIVHAMGDAQLGRVPGFEVKRNNVTRKAYSVPETSYFELRVKEVT